MKLMHSNYPAFLAATDAIKDITTNPAEIEVPKFLDALKEQGCHQPIGKLFL